MDVVKLDGNGDLFGRFPWASALLQFVTDLGGPVEWFASRCYVTDEGVATVVFDTYDLPGNEGFLLSVQVDLDGVGWSFTVVKKVP